MTSAGDLSSPRRRMRKLFCQSGPKPCSGLTGTRPSRFRLIAPSGTSETERRSTAGAQAPRGCSLSSAIWPPLADCRQRLGLAWVEGNRFVEAGEVENLPVVVVQAIG